MQSELLKKADVQDVSSAITEVIVSVDQRKDLEKLRTNIENTKNDLREEVSSTTLQKINGLLDGFRGEFKNLLSRVQDVETRDRKSQQKFTNFQHSTTEQYQ